MEERRQIGKYRIVREISRSSITAVYEAVQPPLDRKVLIKRLHPELTKDPDMTIRFEREAQALGLIRHPNIVHIYDYQADEESVHLVVEWVPGGSVADLLVKHGAVSEREAVAIAVDILDGLSTAHKAGIIHRDIKPDNLLISHGGSIKITDFGLSQFEGSPALTQQGMVIGTPAYMPPEVINTGNATVKSDLYSVGVTLYELVTGENPFLGTNISDTFTRVLNKKPAQLDGVSPKFQKLLNSMLEKKVEKRSESADEVLQGFRELAEEYNVKHGWTDVSKELEPISKEDSGNGSGISPRVRSKSSRTVIYSTAILFILVIASVILYPVLKNDDSSLSENRLDQKEKSVASLDTTIVESEDQKDSSFVSTAIQSADPDKLLSEEQSTKKKDFQDSQLAEKLNDPVEKPIAIDSATEKSSDDQEKIDSTLLAYNDQGEDRGVLPAQSTAAKGYLLLHVDPWANIFFENQFLVQTPFDSALTLPAGTVSLTFVNPEIPPVTKQFSITSSDTLMEKIDLLSMVGIVEFIDAYPWAEVYLDGDYIGRTPLGRRIFLTEGVHQVQFKHPQYGDQKKTIDINPGAPPLTIHTDMTDNQTSK
ncbi:protein kinase [bacterium]|nr:protein kinase [bacterium]